MGTFLMSFPGDIIKEFQQDNRDSVRILEQALKFAKQDRG